MYKAKRKRQKKRRKEWKKEEAKQARIADRQRRIQQEAQRIVQRRVDQGELVVCSQQEINVTRAVSTGLQRANPTSKEIVKQCVQRSNRKVLQRKLPDAKATNTP